MLMKRLFMGKALLAASLFLLNISFLAAQAGSRMEFTRMPCKLLQGIHEREYAIYLPPSYDAEPARKYPVLYLLHGGNCSHADWETYGHLQAVADSLIAAASAKEMIIVCPEGNKNNMIWFNAPHWRYEDFFFQEFIPFIEKNYRAIGNTENRAVGGYSMGGGAAIVYGIHRPDMFRAVYDMSGYLRSQPLEFLKNDPSASWRQQLVDDNNPIRAVVNASEEQLAEWRTVNWFIDCGDEDFTYDANIDLVAAFRSRHIPYELRIKDGGHDWRYWGKSLREAICFVFDER